MHATIKPTLFFLLIAFSFGSQLVVADEYYLATGDRIKITVLGEESLTIETNVTDTGSISYPFLGHLEVDGVTAKQLQKNIVAGLKGNYLINPVVTVSIIEYRPFFVNGKVESPGSFPYQPAMNVRKAITLAGGFKERADKERIWLVPGTSPNSEPVRVELNSPVKPGDAVIVKRSFF